MDPRSIATLGSVWVLCAIMAGIVAGEKNRRFWVWFGFGLLTGPFALYRAVKSFEVVPPDQAQACPNCQKPIRKTLRSCPRCGHVIVREPDKVMKAGQQAAAAFILLRRAARQSTAAVKAEQAKREARKRVTSNE
jgi:hypothetical protein